MRAAGDRRVRSHGFGLTEVLVSLTVALMMLAGVMAALSQSSGLKKQVEMTSSIQNNLRIAGDRLQRDLRMAGFGVPGGPEIGGSALWAPAVFHADSDAIGFRADMDGGSAQVTCRPKASNMSCPLNRLVLDRVDYFDGLGCAPPDGSAGNLLLVAVLDGDTWEAAQCTAVNIPGSYVTLTGNVTDDTFAVGGSRVHTIEQVYIRYVPQASPPYGYLERAVVYGNTPNNTFPPTGATWLRVAEHITSFSFSYENAAGTAMTAPLSAASRTALARIAISMQGFEAGGPASRDQLISLRATVNIRNGAP